MQISLKGINLLRYVSSYNGQKIEQKGQEVDAPRLLNVDESSQRRHFFKNTEEVIKTFQGKVKELEEAHNNLVKEKKNKTKEENPIKDGEKDYDTRINNILNKDSELLESFKNYNEKLNESLLETFEVEVTDKTKQFLKKYYNLYGEEVGYGADVDELNDELSKLFV